MSNDCVASTERLILRHFHILDADVLSQVFGDPEVMRFGDGVQTKEWIEQWLHACLERYYRTWGFGPYAVVKKAGHDVIGYCGLFYFPDINGQPEVEIGYRLARAAWGKGYATEAGAACLKWGFAEFELPYITAMIAPDNARSVRVAERLEFTPTREDVLLGDPVIVYGLQRGHPCNR